MKKEYTLLLAVTLTCLFGYGQQRLSKKFLNEEVIARPTSKISVADRNQKKLKSRRSKSPGDTLYYQTFTDSLPNGWSIFNANANNFQWIWDTVYTPGVLTVGVNSIKSTTASDGFMTLNMDFFNSPGPTSITMDTYVESDSIDLTSNGLNPNGQSSVWISYQQFFYYCCAPAGKMVIQVSSDNFATLTEYDATDGVPINLLNTSNAVAGESNLINISSAAANETSIKIRFYVEGLSQYFWMLDDVALIEGWSQDMELKSQYMEFNSQNYAINPFYGRIPYDLFTPLSLSATLFNNGYNNQTNAKLEIDITHTATPTGLPGTGLVYSTSSTPLATLAPYIDTAVITDTPAFVPLVLGDFQVDFLAIVDSLDQRLGNETGTLNFSTSDTIFARDDGDNGFGGGIGPASFTRNNQPGGTVVGDKFSTLYIIESRSGNSPKPKPTSVTYRVSADSSNIGVEIVPKIWSFDENAATLATAFTEVASTFIPYTVGANSLDTFLTIAFDNGPAFLNGLDSGAYAVGWEVTSITGGTSFEVLNDGSSTVYQALVSTFIDLAHAPGWGWVRGNPGIRLNLGVINKSNSLSASDLTDSNFEVFPNPNNGTFKLRLSNSSALTLNLYVRNLLGQVVYSELLNVNTQLDKQLDLSDKEKGIYFVSLESENQKLVKKVIIF